MNEPYLDGSVFLFLALLTAAWWIDRRYQQRVDAEDAAADRRETEAEKWLQDRG